MATGTTADSNLTRDELIDMALRKLGVSSTTTLTTRATEALNLIIREEDAMNTRQSKSLWALSESAVILTADGFIYTTSENLDNNIIEIVEMVYRNTSGDDSPVDLIDAKQYEQITDKNEKGDVEKAYLKKDITLSSQELYIWPSPDSVGTTSEVTGSDSLNYSCIMGHTSAADNKPITGQNWKLYWKQVGSSGSAWATATDYTNGELLKYTYKRPLYDFDTSTDNPDMPSSWTRYLMYRLAHDFSAEVDADMETRNWLKREYLEARDALFGTTQPNANDTHNKVIFY